MTTAYLPSTADQSFNGPEPALECTNCHSSGHVSIDSIQGLQPKVHGRVAVEYSCDNCQSTFRRDAAVESVAKILTRLPPSCGVLKVGRAYIHCGEPMEPSSPPDGRALGGSAVVLHCHCEFQMDLPVRGQ